MTKCVFSGDVGAQLLLLWLNSVKARIERTSCTSIQMSLLAWTQLQRCNNSDPFEDTQACTNTHAHTKWMHTHTHTFTAIFHCLMIHGCCCDWVNTVAPFFFVLRRKEKSKIIIVWFQIVIFSRRTLCHEHFCSRTQSSVIQVVICELLFCDITLKANISLACSTRSPVCPYSRARVGGGDSLHSYS